MKRLTSSPWFCLIIALVSAWVHGWMLYLGAFDLEMGDALYQNYTEQLPAEQQKPFASGPLLFSFFQLLANLFKNPATGLLAGALVLSGTITYVLLKSLSHIKTPSWLLLSAGLWAIISPSIHVLIIRHPHILLGLIFLLLLFISLTRKNHFLMTVFLIHLLLTHYILAGLSLLLLAGYVRHTRYKKSAIF